MSAWRPVLACGPRPTATDVPHLVGARDLPTGRRKCPQQRPLTARWAPPRAHLPVWSAALCKGSGRRSLRGARSSGEERPSPRAPWSTRRCDAPRRRPRHRSATATAPRWTGRSSVGGMWIAGRHRQARLGRAARRCPLKPRGPRARTLAQSLPTTRLGLVARLPTGRALSASPRPPPHGLRRTVSAARRSR